MSPPLHLRVTRLRRDEGGYTMIEVAMAATIMAVVAAIFLSVLASVQNSVGREQDRSTDNDQARLAVEQLDREILSGNLLYDPAAESPAYYSLRIYTQANASTRSPAFQCVQWLIVSGELKRRSWPPGDPGSVSSWRVIAENVVNQNLSVHAFQLDSDPSKGGRTIDVTILVNNKLSTRPSQTVRIQTSITGRNTSYGYPSNVCSPAPS
jgi:type II secretory pathway pseudopilin PulG